MITRNSLVWLTAGVLVLGSAVGATAADVVFKVVMVEDEDENPAAAGKAAAKALLEAMGDVPLKMVVMSECFEDKENKAKLLKGVCEVLPKEKVLGGATYGSFTQKGCTDFDSVCLLGIGGKGVQTSARLAKEMGTSKLTFENDQDLIRERLHAAGEELAGKLKRRDNDKLLILIADAHSPKVQFLVEGVQKVVGKDFPITGGCANKNAGQTFVYFRGEMYEDAAVALMLAGDFEVALSGRMANEEQAVINSAANGAAEALKKTVGDPAAVLSFNCAGRRSKLSKYEDELAAMQGVLGKDVTLFGCYCAGEIGPVDEPNAPKDVLSGGSGWHVMFTTIAPANAAKAPKQSANASGTITLDGQPIEGAVITLVSQAGQPVARGKTTADGRYVLKTVAGDPQIPAGQFLVTISKTLRVAEGGKKKTLLLLPPKYAEPQTSGFSVEVVAEAMNEFAFELTAN